MVHAKFDKLVVSFSNVTKYVRPIYSNKEELALLRLLSANVTCHHAFIDAIKVWYTSFFLLKMEKCCFGWQNFSGTFGLGITKNCPSDQCNRVQYPWIIQPGPAYLGKCVILSQTKNIEKVLFQFLFLVGGFVLLFVLFKFPKAQQLVYGNLVQIMWLGQAYIS